MSSNVILDQQIELSQLDVEVGQTLTVWLCSATPDGFPRKQVELRVTLDGKAQIFTSGDVELRGFSTWRSEE